MAAGRVIDRIPAAPRRTPFQPDELTDQAPVVEQLHRAGI
jgi:hypothetical protein